MTEIRAYKNTDAEAVKWLIVELQVHERQYDAERAEATAIFTEWYLSRLLDDVRGGHGLFLVAEEDSIVRGYIVGHIEEDVENRTTSFRIVDVVVSESHRGQGIGSLLMRAAEDFARAQGFKRLYVGVLIGNRDVHRLYKELGYEDYVIEMKKEL